MLTVLQDFDLLTLAEVAELLHCSKAHVCKAVAGQVRGCPPIPAVRWAGANWCGAESCWRGSSKTSSPMVGFKHRQNEAARTHKEKYMRTRHSTGGVRKQRGRWIGMWYDGGKRKAGSLASSRT